MRTLRIAGFGAALFVLTAAPGMPGQEARGAELDAVIEEVVVTARRREETLQQVPLAVTAFTGENLIEQGVFTFTEIMNQTPNLHFQALASNNAVGGIAVPTLRAQSSADALMTTDTSVGVYQDGVYIPRTYGFQSNLYDVDRIEVLKGPQGTLYGRNTTGGAINVFARKPDFEGVHGYLTGDVGNHDNLDFRAAVNIPLIDDQLAVRFAGRRDKRDGFGRNDVNGTQAQDDDELGFRGSLLWQPTDAMTVDFRGDWMEVNEQPRIQKAVVPPADVSARGGFLGLLFCNLPLPPPDGLGGPPPQGCDALSRELALDGDPYRLHGSDEETNDLELWGLGLTVTFDLGNSLELKSVTGYREFERNSYIDQDGLPWLILETFTETRGDSFSQEFLLSGVSLDERLTWVGGAYYSVEEGVDGTYSKILTPARQANEGFVENRSWALFAQATWAFNDRWNLTLGGRFTEEEKNLDSRNRRPPQGNLNPPPGINWQCNTSAVPFPTFTNDPLGCQSVTKDTFSDWSYLAALDYQVTDEVLIYLTTRRGFRGGSQQMRQTFDPVTATPVEPEFATDYELGIKADLFNNRMRVNVAGFITDYEDIQISTLIPSGLGTQVTTVVQNAAKASVDGFELELWAYPAQGLSLKGTLGFIDATYDDFPSLATDTQGNVIQVNRAGERLLQSPYKWNYSLEARYEMPVWSSQGGRLSFQVNWNGHSNFVRDPRPQFPEPLYSEMIDGGSGIINARVGLELENSGIVIAAYARNLTDKEQIREGLDIAALGMITQAIEERREWGVQLTKRFGSE